MFDFNFLNRCMIIQNPEKGVIEMKQFLNLETALL